MEFYIDPTLNINMTDKLGNTPLTLTSKLAYRHLDYFEIAEILLEKGADAKIRDRSGWSCVDEAVGQVTVNKCFITIK